MLGVDKIDKSKYGGDNPSKNDLVNYLYDLEVRGQAQTTPSGPGDQGTGDDSKKKF